MYVCFHFNKSKCFMNKHVTIVIYHIALTLLLFVLWMLDDDNIYVV